MKWSLPKLAGVLEYYSVITCDESANSLVNNIIESKIPPERKHRLIEDILDGLPKRIGSARIQRGPRGRPATNDITFYVFISREINRLRDEGRLTLEDALSEDIHIPRTGLRLRDALMEFRFLCENTFYGDRFFTLKDCQIDTLLRYYRKGCALEGEM